MVDKVARKRKDSISLWKTWLIFQCGSVVFVCLFDALHNFWMGFVGLSYRTYLYYITVDFPFVFPFSKAYFAEAYII